MKFLDSSALWHLFWALPLLAAMTLWYFFRGKKLLRKIFPSGDPGEYSNVHYGKRIVRALLLLGAVAALGFALARPAWGVRKTESPVQTRDILIVLDISRSMLSDNVKPSRLDHARYLIRDMTENMPDTRFGIMAFAGNPVRVCPMTLDRTQLLNKLDAVSPADAPRGGTNLEAALNSAFNSVKYGSAGLNRAVVLISDGGELEGDYQKTFAKYKKEKIPVFTIGVGEPENPALIPLESGRLLRDNQGNTVNAPLQEDALQTIARETGGDYIRSTTINSGSAELRRALEKVVPEEKTLVAETDVERPALPLALAFIFLVCFFLLSERRKTAKIFLFTGCLLCLTLFSFAVEAEQTAERTENETDTVEKTPTAIYNEALRTHKKGDTENAVKLYEQVISHKDSTPELRANAFLNMGVIRQTAARKIAEEALAPETTANPDGAIRKIDAALAGLDTAQEDYRNSLRTHSAGSRSTVKNQTLLIRDREKLEELKKKLEELKKQQQQAQQQTQQALQQQQQQQTQQALQQQQQQAQQQQQQQQQTQQAQQDAEKLADQAEKLDQKQLAQNAKDAAEKLKDAQQQQKKGDQKGAERSIREALEKLGGGKDGQDQKDGQEGQEKNKDQDKNGKEENKNAPSSGKDGQEQKDGQEDDPSSEPSENKNDTGKDGKEKKEAESPSDVRVDQMRRDNEKFRKEVEKIRKMRLQSLPVEKDW